MGFCLVGQFNALAENWPTFTAPAGFTSPDKGEALPHPQDNAHQIGR
jgi:hypothetical protein